MLLGHQKQRDFLKKSIELGKVAHAYLFCGQEQLGKKAVAEEFIKTLNCQEKDYAQRPCQKCVSCVQIEKKINPDLSIVGTTEKEIQISQIRDLCWNLGLKPYSSLFKAAIVDEAEKMNSESANALLKTLEEPSGRAVLILISSRPETLPKTIVSRTQLVKFFPLARPELEKYLEKDNLSEEKKEELISFSEGRPGRLIEFISEPHKLEEEKERLEELKKIIQSDLAFRFQYAKKVADSEGNIGKILEAWQRYFRNFLVSNLNNRQGSKELGFYSVPKLQKIIKTTEEMFFLVSSTNVNPKMALEMVMLEL